MRKVSILTLALGRKSNLFGYLMASYKFSSHSHVDTAFGVTLAGAAVFSRHVKPPHAKRNHL